MPRPFTDDAAGRHRIPVIDRAMEVLALLGRREGEVTVGALAARLQLPRTSVYRILNTLLLHDMVRRSPEGIWRLGPRLVRLAAAVGSDEFDLATLAQPHLDRLSVTIGESAKLSVVDGEGILVLAASQGRREYALTVVPGQKLPIHAGAAGKVLLAWLPDAEQAQRLALPLAAFTPKTLTDAKRLKTELARIRRRGWAEDKGETAPSIHAFAAPVFGRAGGVVAALSVPFLAGTDAARQEQIRVAVLSSAAALGGDIPEPNKKRSDTDEHG